MPTGAGRKATGREKFEKTDMRCAECGGESFTETLLPEYGTELPGIRVVLMDTVIRFTCNHCGTQRLRLPRAEELAKVLALVRDQIPVKLAGDELKFLRKTLGMTQAVFCEQILPGADTSYLSRMEKDSKGMGGYSEL